MIKSASAVTYHKAPGLDVVILSRNGIVEHYITANPVAGRPQFTIFQSVAEYIKKAGAAIVMQDVFGPCRYYKAGMLAIEFNCGPVNWPVAWMEGDGYVADSLTSTQVYAVSGAEVTPVYSDGRPVGATYEDSDAKYCLLGDIRPSDIKATCFDQAYQTFVNMDKVLRTVGMDFSNVARTWLYASRILEWYGDLNKARDRFFREHKVFENLVPASTGIGVLNPFGAAMIADVLAVQPKEGRMKIEKVSSPLQCSALDYQSSFSRAVELVAPDHRMIMVSGTASIEPGGATAHVGDVTKQMDLSMKVVLAILESRGMGWSDVSRAAVYLKDISNAPLFHDYCIENNIPLMPAAVAHADICRDDLLFEIELDALKVTN